MSFFVQFTILILASCVTGPGAMLVEKSRADDASKSPGLTPPSAPRQYFWDLAPCGEEWEGWWQCSPEGRVHYCGASDERGSHWLLTYWPCECVDNDTGELLVGPPDCWKHE